MLKFLRKYNTWIMVIAGSLLMVTFLLQQSLQELGKQQAMRSTLRVNGQKVSGKDLDLAYREFTAIKGTLSSFIVEEMLGIKNSTHWYLLTREAEAAGLVGGPRTGQEFLPSFARDLVSETRFMLPQAQQEQEIASLAGEWLARLDGNGAQARLTPDQTATAVAKVKGVLTLRSMFRRLPRYSDRRLAADFRQLEDSTGVDFVFIPPDREVTNVERPTEEAIAAFYEKYKGVAPGEKKDDEFVVGYKQPERVKIEWLVISRKAIEEIVTPDALEVQKRFLRMYPSGTPTAGSVEGEKERIAGTIKAEMVEKILQAADMAIKSEVDKAVRQYRQDGRYWVLPSDWATTRPTLEKFAEAASRQMNDAAGESLPAPKIVKGDGEWKPLSKLASLDGIGRSQVLRGDRGESFTQIALKAREIAGNNDYNIQVGIPPERTTDGAGNVYYYILTDARKPSAPDSIDEVRADVVKDLMQIEAYKRLAMRTDEYRTIAAGAGLDPLTKPESGKMAGVIDSATLPINKGTVRLESVTGNSAANSDVNHEAFRKAVVDAAAKLDPTKKIAEIPLAERTVVVAIPQSRGIGAAVITGLSPVTLENFRARQPQAVGASVRREFTIDEASDPYSFPNMEKRLKVEDTSPKNEQEEEKPVAATQQ